MSPTALGGFPVHHRDLHPGSSSAGTQREPGDDSGLSAVHSGETRAKRALPACAASWCSFVLGADGKREPRACTLLPHYCINTSSRSCSSANCLSLSYWAELESLDSDKDADTDRRLRRLEPLGFRLMGTNKLCFPVKKKNSCN